MTLYVGDLYTRYWEPGGNRPVGTADNFDYGAGYPNSAPMFPAESAPPMEEDPLASADMGLPIDNSLPTEAHSNMALVKLQNLTANGFQDQKFLSAEDKKLFKAANGTEQELASSVHGLRHSVAALGQMDVENQKLALQVAQLTDEMNKFQRALSMPRYANQHAQISARLAQLQKQKTEAEQRQGRLEEQRAERLNELKEAQTATQALLEDYQRQTESVKTKYDNLKAQAEKSPADVQKAPYLLKQANGMKDMSGLIQEALAEVNDIVAGKASAPVLNLTEEAPEAQEATAEESTENKPAAETENALSTKDITSHLAQIAEFTNGLKLTARVQNGLKTAETDEDIENAFKKPYGQGQNAFQMDNSLMTVYKFLEDPEGYKIENEALWEKLKPILNLTPEQREQYKDVVKYMMTHYDDMRLANDAFFGDPSIDVADLKAIEQGSSQAAHKLNKTLTELLGTASETSEVVPESGEASHSEEIGAGETHAENPSAGTVAASIAATGAALYGAKKVQDRYGAAASQSIASKAQPWVDKIKNSETGQSIQEKAARLKAKMSGTAKTVSEPDVLNGKTPSGNPRVVPEVESAPKTAAGSASSTAAKPNMAESLNIQKDMDHKHFQLKKEADLAKQPIEKRLNITGTDDKHFQLKKEADADKLKVQKAKTVQPKVMSRGSGFVTKAGTFLGGRWNLMLTGLMVIWNVSQPEKLTQSGTSVIAPDA